MSLLPIVVSILRLPHGKDLPLPSYATPLSAGLDLRAGLELGEDVVLPPGERKLVPTGLAMALPAGFEAQVRPRSGLALNHGVTVLNAPGTIDADYRGELKVLLINLGRDAFRIRRGDRIAQLVIAPVVSVTLEEVTSLGGTARSDRGFGSSGI